MFSRNLTVFAPAKINLYLHVNERLPNGYHSLDSLVAFANIGDEISIAHSDQLRFEVQGDFSQNFSAREMDVSANSENLVMRAAWGLARASGHSLDNLNITLNKNLPFGAGIGGGSADAAAVIHALLQYWNISVQSCSAFLPELLNELGADVPVCFARQSARIISIGDVFEPVPYMPDIPVVLIYPGKSCSTPQIFGQFDGQFKSPIKIPDFTNADILIKFLQEQENHLYPPAQKLVPEIDNVIRLLSSQNDCSLARMSGSGSCCFGLFDTQEKADDTARIIKEQNPDWWIKSGMIGHHF